MFPLVVKPRDAIPLVTFLLGISDVFPLVSGSFKDIIPVSPDVINSPFRAPLPSALAAVWVAGCSDDWTFRI